MLVRIYNNWNSNAICTHMQTSWKLIGSIYKSYACAYPVVATAFSPKLHIYVHQKTYATMFKKHHAARIGWIIIIVIYNIMENYTAVRIYVLILQSG